MFCSQLSVPRLYSHKVNTPLCMYCSVQDLFNSEQQSAPRTVRSVSGDSVESEGSEDERLPALMERTSLVKQEEKWDCESILRYKVHHTHSKNTAFCNTSHMHVLIFTVALQSHHVSSVIIIIIVN